ncbi:MAG: hypothetical protein HRU18_01720 [Pseudoalteromonas sp.]|uniref:hypothetical protein n=1 Tax=Pseudoalteromonas sp. TaxID=53249 RepID=UPI001D6F8F63|nr:hypothetical protein [Pseudoalteromonas sp.]NRA76900.1 hypothetical protein [Pseudoalteromonas sp.]
MLKIGRVYQFENAFWYVESKRKYKRVLYRLRRVHLDGSLSEIREVHFKRGAFDLVEKARAYVKIDIPKSVRRQMQYQNHVKNTRKILMEYADKEKRQPHKDYIRQLAQHSYYMIGHYDHKRKVVIDLRIFAKDIGLKSGAKLYNIMAVYFQYKCSDDRYSIEMPKLTDASLIGSYEQLTNTWKYIYGYSKKLDHFLEKDLKGHIAELKRRDINLAIKENKYLQPDC